MPVWMKERKKERLKNNSEMVRAFSLKLNPQFHYNWFIQHIRGPHKNRNKITNKSKFPG